MSRQRFDVHVLDEDGRTVEVTAVRPGADALTAGPVEVTAVRPDADALRTLVARVLRHGQEVSAAIESMTGARFVPVPMPGWLRLVWTGGAEELDEARG